MAQDLHDQLGADLTEIVLAGAHARRQLLNQNRAVDAKLTQMEATAVRLIERLTEIVWLTKPTNDTLQCLADYLGDLAVETLEKAGFTCMLDIPAHLPNIQIASDLRHDLVLAAKEAIHNAIKHSGGDSGTFAVRVDGDIVEFAVRDNGRGFDPASRSRIGDGHSNMRARLTRHGGSTRLETSSAGTSVVFSVRIPPPLKEVHS